MINSSSCFIPTSVTKIYDSSLSLCGSRACKKNRQYGSRDRLLLRRGASGSILVTHRRVAWMVYILC